jgi:hypothetical protein
VLAKRFFVVATFIFKNGKPYCVSSHAISLWLWLAYLNYFYVGRYKLPIDLFRIMAGGQRHPVNNITGTELTASCGTKTLIRLLHDRVLISKCLKTFRPYQLSLFIAFLSFQARRLHQADTGVAN